MKVEDFFFFFCNETIHVVVGTDQINGGTPCYPFLYHCSLSFYLGSRSSQDCG